MLLLTACREQADSPAPGEGIAENGVTPYSSPAASPESIRLGGSEAPQQTPPSAAVQSPLASPATSPVATAGAGIDAYSSNATVKSFLEKGYQIQQEHVFTHTFEGMGQRTIIPVATYEVIDDSPVSLILLGGEKDVVLTPAERTALFSSFEAISFKDMDDYSLKSGYGDISFIADFITGAGHQGAIPFSRAFIFRNDAWGNFVEDHELQRRVEALQANRTLTMKEVFDLTRPFDIKGISGSFKAEFSYSHSVSLIDIHQIDEDEIVFSVDAYYDGYDNEKNVHVGQIEKGIAQREGPYKAVYQADDAPFTLRFEFYGKDSFQVTEEGSGVFGMNVSARGEYKRQEQ